MMQSKAVKPVYGYLPALWHPPYCYCCYPEGCKGWLQVLIVQPTMNTIHLPTHV
jgi:hypothetical protein